jgi:hypothetical protein
MALMKDKLNQLESLNRELICKLDIKSRYQQIKELMGDRTVDKASSLRVGYSEKISVRSFLRSEERTVVCLVYAAASML